MQLLHRNIKEAYRLLLSKIQPLNPLPRKVWKQRGLRLEGSVAGPRPGAGQCGLAPCCSQATKSLKSKLGVISTNLTKAT